ncbi:MAG TPA: hypothetical protein VLA00_04805 [Xanthobacteraceae bacterium]|nr:hypothetical protein [Xanthobacteraceae bacterium]
MTAQTNADFADDNAALFANATPMQLAYMAWLSFELKMLRHETDLPGFTPDGTFAESFHFPVGGSWQDVAPASSRAETVLRAVGVALPA